MRVIKYSDKKFNEVMQISFFTLIIMLLFLVLLSNETNAQGYTYVKEKDKIILKSEISSLVFILNRGNWVNHEDGVYFEEDEDRLYAISSSEGIDKAEYVQNAMSEVFRIAHDYMSKACQEKLTKEKMQEVPAFYNRIISNPAWKGIPLEEIIPQLNPCAFNTGFYSSLTKYIFIDKTNNVTRVLWQMPKNTGIFSILDIWRNTKNGKTELPPDTKKYIQNLKDLLRKEQKLIKYPLTE